jgi:hypothetical protein
VVHFKTISGILEYFRGVMPRPQKGIKLRPDALASNRFATLVPTILALLAAAVLAGCGGGNPKAGTTDTGTTGTPANSIQVMLSSSTLATSPVAPIDVTAIILDANNHGLSGRTVTFAVVDSVGQPAFLNNVTPATGVSDVNGQVTAKLNLGNNTTIRTLTVTATVDGITSPIQPVTVAASSTPTSAAAHSIQVVPSSGTLLSSGATPVALTATVLDINNNGIPGKVVSFAVIDNVANPAFVTNIAAGGVTDNAGQATARLNLGANTSNRSIIVRVTVDTTVIGTTTVTVAASAAAPAGSIQLLLSSGSLPASSATPLVLTAVVLDATKSIGLAGKNISFTVTDPDPGPVFGPAFINSISTSGVSDANGLVTANLNIGANKTPRNLTVTVSVDSVSTSATVAVTNAGSPIARSVQLLVSSPTLPSAGIGQVDLTAIVLDANNNAMAGKPVTFAVADTVPVAMGQAFINNKSGGGSTDANGLVTAKLNVGADKSNRSVRVTITVDATITAFVDVAIAGTSITISGLNSVVLNANLALTAQLKDSAGTPISGKPLTITSSALNPISAPPNTDLTGQLAFTVTGTHAGADTITISGMGATQVLPINVNASAFSFTAPLPPNTNIVINTTSTILTVHWGNPTDVIGQPILFSATRGTLLDAVTLLPLAGAVNTNGSGNASVKITSPSTGLATITATGTGGVGVPTATINLIYITTTASNVSLQASPATVPVNLSGQSSSFSALTAVVRDANNNLVKGALVNFQIVTDPSGGQLSGSGSAITDINGVATVNYIAGTTSSPQNGVRVDATVVSGNGITVTPGTTASVFLTTGGQSLFIRVETDNQIDTGTAGVFTKKYYALVTDSGGNPVPNTTVVFAVRPAQVIRDYASVALLPSGAVCGGASCPGAFQKGRYYLCEVKGNLGGLCPGIGYFKLPGLTPLYDCLNEDVNFNGILDPGEDTDGNGSLTPGNVAAVNRTAITDNTGIAVASVVYPRGYATWASVTLTTTTGVAGTESKQTVDFDLPGVGNDYSNVLVPPPGMRSPFGESACNVPN